MHATLVTLRKQMTLLQLKKKATVKIIIQILAIFGVWSRANTGDHNYSILCSIKLVLFVLFAAKFVIHLSLSPFASLAQTFPHIVNFCLLSHLLICPTNFKSFAWSFDEWHCNTFSHQFLCTIFFFLKKKPHLHHTLHY